MAENTLLPFPPHFLLDFVTTSIYNTLPIAKLTFLYINPEGKLLISNGQFGNPYLEPPRTVVSTKLIKTQYYLESLYVT